MSSVSRSEYAACARIIADVSAPDDARRRAEATLAAATGATLADLMARLGHSTVGAAMIYQHAVQGKGKVLAARLSEIALGEV